MTKQEFGTMIREAREQKGLTHEALANRIGVYYQGLSYWERGIKLPDAISFLKLADVLDLDVKEITSRIKD